LALKLNQRTVAGLELPRGKNEVFFWDDDLAGFGLRLRRRTVGGPVRRTWVVQYRARGGRGRRLKIGGGELTPERARAKATEIRARVALGEDPQADRERERAGAASTLRAVLEDYLVLKQAKLRASSYKVTRLYLLGPYFKPLHSTAVNAIERADVARRLNAITIQNGTNGASRARAHLSAFYTWAMTQGIVEKNPVIGTEKPDPPKSRERVLTDVELAAIWRACPDDAYGKIVKLLMLTGCRRDEIGGLRWSEIAPDRSSFTLPEARTKNAHAHTLPITPLAHSIIKTIPEQVGRDFVFGGYSASGFTGWSDAKKALDQRLAGTVSGWRLHDLRRTLATWLADDGDTEPHIIEAVVNHWSKGHRSGVAGVYNRAKYSRQIKAALALWDDHLRSLVEGGARRVLKFAPESA
jgi:integrase